VLVDRVALQDTMRTLGDRAFEAAVADGARKSPEDGIAFALGTRVQTSGSLSSRVGPAPLTRREQQIAELVAEGLSLDPWTGWAGGRDRVAS
jgi:DNA-binding NarL/FixJ family response regulator